MKLTASQLLVGAVARRLTPAARLQAMIQAAVSNPAEARDEALRLCARYAGVEPELVRTLERLVEQARPRAARRNQPVNLGGLLGELLQGGNL